MAVGHLAASLAVPFEPSGRAGTPPREGGSVLLRMPPELKERLVRRAAERRQTVNQLIVGTLSERLGLNGKEPMASNNGSSNGKTPGEGQGPRRDHRRRQLRELPPPGRASTTRTPTPEDSVPGLMHVDLGGYHIRDIEFVAAFDVVKGKVGVDLADAIWAHPNDTIKFADVPKTGVTVNRGMTLDGIGKYMAEVVEKAPGETDDVVGILKERNVDVVVNYLPVGSEDATKWYVEQILQRRRSRW